VVCFLIGLEKLKKQKITLPKTSGELVTQLLTFFFIIGLPVLTLIISEIIVRDALEMPFLNWTSNFTKRFAVNVLFIVALFNLFYIFPRKIFMFVSILISGTLLFFAFANKMKLELRNSPITMGDFALLNELRGLEQPVEINKLLLALILLIIIALVVAIFLLLPKKKENWLIKTIVFLMSGSFLFTFWSDYPISPMEETQFQNTWWRQELGTMRNGLFGNFVLLAKNSQIAPPANYSEGTVESIVNEYKPTIVHSEDKPNVIFIMSEAFTDPLYFGEQHFSEDPIPNFRMLFRESMHGMMYSPEFGGGTANVEFEALTGFSRQFLPDNSVAYQLYVKRPIPSVAYSFREAGYHATAVHSFYGWYYQRQSVYRYLGFDQFISGEFMNLDHQLGTGHGYPKDKHMTDTILSQIDNTEERDFIHAVTVEAHHPYKPLTDSKFLKKGTLPDSTRQFLNSYTEYLHSVDKELGRLVEELKKRNEPTILVYFGDHFPTFLSNAQVYGSQGTGIATNILHDYEDYLNTHKLPYFIWRSENNIPIELDLSPNQFSAISLSMAGVQGNTVTAILDRMREENKTVIPYNLFKKQMGDQTKEMKDLHLLQYDLLHGRSYSKKEEGYLNVEPRKEYFLGEYKNMKLKEVTKLSNSYQISVVGVPKYAKLINEENKEIKSQWVSSRNGVADFLVNKRDINTNQNYRFAVYDSMGNILRATEQFKIKSN
jgi:phosphoglycerol transferase MdoB-like AlkP superfamily enzyme